jgi:fermentation-respiration switch protein FrsA (DUF1100 family)
VLRETTFARTALGLIAIHCVVDAVLVIEPGTSVGSRLPAAVVCAAALGTLAFAYPRMRPGLRASLSAIVGVLGLVSGIAGMVESESRAIPTTLAAIVAGATLVVLAVRTAWSSRKHSGRPVLRRTLIGLGAVLVAFELVLPVSVGIVATHRPESDVSVVAGARPVKLRTSDSLTITARYVPSRNGAAVIVAPDSSWTQDHVEMLRRHGYGVLAIDTRGRGTSQGEPNAYGWDSWRDISAGAEFLARRPEVDDARIGGLGLSVGGEQMIDAAAADPRIRAVVTDGAGERSIREVVERGLAAALVLPQQAVLTTAVALFSGSTPPPSLSDQVAELSPRPLLLIEAGQGNGGEERNADYFRSAGEPKEHWIVPGATHTHAIDQSRAQYERRVIGFFDQSLAPASERSESSSRISSPSR